MIVSSTPQWREHYGKGNVAGAFDVQASQVDWREHYGEGNIACA